ncbi:hypothetical protein ACSBR1_027190 [Camellia fascicularis]
MSNFLGMLELFTAQFTNYCLHTPIQTPSVACSVACSLLTVTVELPLPTIAALGFAANHRGSRHRDIQVN